MVLLKYVHFHFINYIIKMLIMILMIVIMWEFPIKIIINIANLDILQFIWYQNHLM